MELMTQDEFNQALADIVKLVYDRGIQQNPFTTREFTQIWNGMGAAYAAALARIAMLEEATMNYAVNVCPEQDRIIAAQREQIERLLTEAAHS